MGVLDTIFKYPKEQYKNNINPLKDYAEIVSSVMGVMNNTTDNISKLKKYVKDNKLFKNPIVTFYERDLKGDRTVKKTSLSDYISYVKRSGDIIVPSFTVYFSKDKKASLHAEFININVKERSKHKKLAFKYKLAGEWEKFNYHNVIQKVKKIFNNSLSGAYASMGTILNNASAHYTLTSITRVVSGIGNIISESYISGNRHYRDPDITFNHVATIAHSLDMDLVKIAVEEHNLHLPTGEEVFYSILKSTSKYWRDVTKEKVLLEYFNKLSPYQRAAILYHNDFFHLRTFNDELMRDMLSKAITFEHQELTDEAIEDTLSTVDEWLYVLAIYVVNERLVNKNKDQYTREDKVAIVSFILNITEVYVKYASIYKAFMITDIFPTSLSYLKEMVREAIVLSDTDSTCATYENWVEWYFGKQVFSSESVAVAATIMTFVTVGTDHYIKAFSGNMNITYEASQVLAMKNEFFWDVFVNTNVSKHYYANVVIQEGNVYDKNDEEGRKRNLEKKGVNLIAPNAYEPTRELSEKIMIGILKSIGDNKKISANEILDEVIAIEHKIYDMILKGSPDVLKLEKIKPEKSYKLSKYSSPFAHYLLWQDIFSKKYGNAPDPQYMAVKLPTTITNKNKMNAFIDSIKDTAIQSAFREYMRVSGKTHIGVFRLPLTVVYQNGLPEELLSVINYKQVIKDNVKHIYMVLESIGYHVKDEGILIEELEDVDVYDMDDAE